MRITTQEFRQACGTVIAFIRQHRDLTDKQRDAAIDVIKWLSHNLAPSSEGPPAKWG